MGSTFDLNKPILANKIVVGCEKNEQGDSGFHLLMDYYFKWIENKSIQAMLRMARRTRQ